MHPFGGTPRCPRCEKAVYAAEQVMGPGRKLYHKSCLTCKDCNKRLDSYSLVEHNEEPYCKNCHRKVFGTRDLRAQNLPYRPASPERAPLSPVRTGFANGAAPALPVRASFTGTGAGASAPPPVRTSFANGGGAAPALPVRANFTGSGGAQVFGAATVGRGALLRPTRALSPTRPTFAESSGSFAAAMDEPKGSPSPPLAAVAEAEAAAPAAENDNGEDRDEEEVERALRLPQVVPGTKTHTEVNRNGLPRTGQLVPHSPTKPVRAPAWDDDDGGDAGAAVSVSASTPVASVPPPAFVPAPSPSAPALPPRMGMGMSATVGRRAGPAAAPLRQTPTGNRFVGGSSPVCARCQKSVYFAEQTKALGRTWHKACLRCTECGTTLDSTRLTEREGVPYCHRCYNKVHGPAGSGYALLGKAGG